MQSAFRLLSGEFRGLKMTCVVLTLCAATGVASPAQTLTTLHNFAGQPSDGKEPYAGLVRGTDGNFYGTTFYGGANNKGTVFKITPNGTLTVLHSFSGSDGQEPSASLIQATDGNFYGTTSIAGSGGSGGTVFKITAGGALTTLVTFDGEGGPEFPYSGVIEGSDGNFYGTTPGGGTHDGNGTVYKITPSGTVTTLYNFACTSGCDPFGGLVEGTDGNFYGTTRSGGADGFNYGTVFKITASGTLTFLHTFEGTDGGDPYAALIEGSDGNFYGTTSSAGAHGAGTVFKITAGGTLTTIYSFCPGGYPCADGQEPYAGLIQATGGNFYGTTYIGGANNVGTIFEITPQGTLTTLHSFNGGDGAGPEDGLVQGTNGNFYGTTSTGGTNGYGTVFELAAETVPTTTVLASTPNPSYQGESVMMTATVMAQNGSTPSGTVIFMSDGTQIGSASLNSSGVAVLNFTGLAVGSDTLTAVYQGFPPFEGSTSNPVTQVVLPASMTSVTSTPNPSTFGELVTMTATVGPSGPPPPTGTVSFTSNGTAIAGCTDVPLSRSLMAQCTSSSLPVGTDIIVAMYSGDSNYGPSSGMVAQIVNPVPSPVQFVSATPCRIVDTRNPDGPFGGPQISGGTARSFPLAQSGNPCNIPSNAVAYSLNVTVVPSGPLGYLTIWPTGEGQPLVSTLNSSDGRVKANAAIVPAGTPSGSVSVYVTNTTNVILDISGYFLPSGAGTLQFYPLTPCRVVDTRQTNFPPGLGAPSFGNMETRELPVLTNSPCLHGLPNTPQAYSFNVTVVPYPAGQPLNYLTIWPSNEQQPTVSTLNNPTATVVANAAIVPADPTNGNVSVFTYNSTDVIIDINGYFATPGENGYSFYVVTPCRAYDSRNNNGQPFQGQRTVPIANSPCAPPATAAGYVFNATVVPSGVMPYLTLWPDSEQQPIVSTLNAYDGYITSNMAVVPNVNGNIDAYAAGLTQLIMDISGYFAR